ncbi:BspA family leucine-rich repeat surface protein [Cryomorpha ignava]|uniref:BspA family leucine-rich repeat surface protein n=1 Tax=Cryomorpha ignava TaxID=101383 RepID=A0A7K3WNK8_9FLAO|nr:BspA family leucine-rich repeat surface protein [Cryomorpha ignava]NEN23239.1 BspA family leucine-rich repeat surface protein [Cryomorpha ignava]
MTSKFFAHKIISLTTVFLLFFGLVGALAQAPFITVWKTDNTLDINGNPIPNATEDNQIQLVASGDYNYTWIELDEEGAPTSNTDSGNASGTLTLTFPYTGIYRLEVMPSELNNNPFHQINFEYDYGDSYKLIRLEQWGDVEWSSMKEAFYFASNMEITATDIPDLSQVTSMQNAFAVTHLSYIPNINNWDVSNVTDMSRMFEGAINFNSPLGNWDVSNVEDMTKMFYAAQSFNQPLANWNTSNVTAMQYMFTYATDFNQALANWDVSSVTNMHSMFTVAISFNQPLNDWDVSNVENMSQMFAMTHDFNQPLGDWDVSNVVDMSGMFANSPYLLNADAVFNYPIGNWDVSNVEDMSGMFAYNHIFNQPLQNWDVHNVTNMGGMFNNAISFNQPLENWDVHNVTTMIGMFNNATSFNQPLGNWDVSNVEDMFEIFTEASSFNQSLANWNLSSLQPIYHQPVNNNHISLAHSGIDCENYSQTLYAWSQNPNTASDIKMYATGLHYSMDESIVSAHDDLLEMGWSIYGDSQGNCALSIEGVEIDKISLYPNPTTGTLYISGLHGTENLQLVDVSGQLVKNLTANPAALPLKLQGLSKGLYFLKIKVKNGQEITKKVIKI